MRVPYKLAFGRGFDKSEQLVGRVETVRFKPVVFGFYERNIIKFRRRRAARFYLRYINVGRGSLQDRGVRFAREIAVFRRAPVVFKLVRNRRDCTRRKHDASLARKRFYSAEHAPAQPRQREHFAVERAAALKQRRFHAQRVAVGREHDVILVGRKPPCAELSPERVQCGGIAFVQFHDHII